MSSERELNCPVCRAKQTLRATCRRCKADLRLVMHAYQRLDYLLSQRASAALRADQQRLKDIDAELQWLSPSLSNQ